jgi:transposase
VGAHDEIYQAGDPVLVGCDTFSTYCYLLSLEETCDANTWGVRLLELSEKQGLAPDHTIADGGPAARRGQKDAWPDVPCHGDVFHALYPLNKLICYLDNRVIDALKIIEELKHKIQCPRGKWKQEENRQTLFQSLEQAETALGKSFSLAEDVATLYRWLKNDILSLVGPSYQDRRDLLQFVIDELFLRENACRHRIEPVRKYLENHKDNLLEFVPLMEKRLEHIAKEFNVPLESVMAVYRLKGLASSGNKRWEQYNALRGLLSRNFYPIEAAVDEVLNAVVRASSLVENLNSRLRNYFTLRKQLGNDYLELLRFYLNHRRFNTSEKVERVDKSPTELLTGISHKHWLELLGYERFKRAA